MTESATAFEVLDALGWAQLVKRRGDLGGSAPMRAVQGCTPLLEGNAFGFQLSLRQPLLLRRESGRLVAAIASPYGEALAAAHQAVLPRLIAAGILNPRHGVGAIGELVTVEERDSGEVHLRLWTGLFLRPDAGVWLRVSATANRRNRLIDVSEDALTDAAGFTPLIVKIVLRASGADRLRLDGEIATVAPVVPEVRIDEATLADAPEIGAAHAAFYDPEYFDAKSRGVTRKYRQLDLPPRSAERDLGEACRVITIGPAAHTVVGGISRVVFANLVPFEASYDGYAVTVEPDRQALRAGARAVERAFAEAMGPTFLGKNPRAVNYFTKHFTQHPPGEPHFFLKPWAFMQTPPGWSCLLEGVHGDGFDVLRGVVATDVFHATPAVFQLLREGVPIRVGYGEPLLQVLPIPRWMVRAGFREVTLPSGA